MKLIFESWRKYLKEEASEEKIEDVVVDVLKDEGGAAGLDPIEKAVDELELPEGFDLKDFLKGLRGVGQHEDGDYILEDGEEIHVKEGIEIFLEAQEEMLDEKKRKKKKKKKKKKGKKDACYHKVKSRYSVWPSAYASGALVKCRKVGAANWGTGGKKKKLSEADPKKGTGKKPKGSGRRLYTDENPKDTVSVKFKTAQDIRDTLSKESFKSKSHKRQSQIINLIHQRVRAAYQNAKDPEVKSRLKKAYDYAKKRKEASKEKTKRMNKEK